MLVVFGVSFVYASFISFIIQILTVHQFGALGMIMIKHCKAFLCCFHGRLWQPEFRTFTWRLAWFLSGLFLALPIIGTNALFEKKLKYTLVTGGFGSYVLQLWRNNLRLAINNPYKSSSCTLARRTLLNFFDSFS
jgi:hypothetical protein